MEKGERLKNDLFSTMQKIPAPADQDDIKSVIDRVVINSRKFKETFKLIVRDLHILNQHQDEVEKITGKSFKEFVAGLGVAKSHLSEINAAYTLCLEYNRPELFETQDIKKLVAIARADDPKLQKKLLSEIDDLTRQEISEKVKVRQSNRTTAPSKRSEASQKGPGKEIRGGAVSSDLDEIKARISAYMKRVHPARKQAAAKTLITHISKLLK